MSVQNELNTGGETVVLDRPSAGGVYASLFEKISLNPVSELSALHSRAGRCPVVAETCLNHRIKGVEGIYNRHQYFNERKAALSHWWDLMVALTLNSGESYNVTPLKKAD